MLLDRYNLTPYHYSTPKVGHLPPVKCPASPTPSQTPASGHFLPLVKAHTKLPILTAYPYLTVISITVARCEIRLVYAASIGRLVWALARGASDRQGGFDWKQVTRNTWLGINDLPSAWHNDKASHHIAIEQHFYWCLFKLLLAKNF